MFFFVLVFWMTWLHLPNKKIDCFPAHQTRTRIDVTMIPKLPTLCMKLNGNKKHLFNNLLVKVSVQCVNITLHLHLITSSSGESHFVSVPQHQPLHTRPQGRHALHQAADCHLVTMGQDRIMVHLHLQALPTRSYCVLRIF